MRASSPEPTPTASLSRRQLLRIAAVVGGGGALSALLAACGAATSTPTTAATTAPTKAAASAAPSTAASAAPGGAASTAPSAAPSAAAAASATRPATAAASTAPSASGSAAPAAVGPTTPPVGSGKGKTLKMARNAEPFSPFVPWQIDDNPALFLSVNMYDSLLRTSKDGRSVEPGLATKWESSSDGLTWTFTLRDGVKFSDGAALKAADVKASLEQCAKGEKSGWKDNYKAISEVQAPDDKTVKIVLSQPYAPLLSTLAMFCVGVMPADMAKASDAADFDATKTRGTGAYMLNGWKKGDPVVLKQNPNYWRGLTGPETISIEYVPDDNSRILKLQGGEVDVIDFVPLSQIQSLGTLPTLKVQAFTIQQFDVLTMNVEKKPLDDLKVRQALNYALDKEALIKSVYFGNATFMNSPIPPGTYWDKTLPGYPFNLDKAKQLIAASSSPSGFTLDFSIRSGDTKEQQIATIAKDQWAKIGVTVNIQQLETSVLRQSYREGKLTIWRGGWTNDMNDPTQIVNYEMRGGASPFALWTHYNNPTLNDKITKADLEQDTAKRETAYAEIQKIYLEDAPIIPLVYPPATAAWQKTIEGFFIDGLSYYRFEDVKINK